MRHRRLFWRVYRHGLLVAFAGAIGTLSWLYGDPPWRGTPERTARILAAAPPEALADRARELADVLGVDLAVYDASGRLEASAGRHGPPPPLDEPPRHPEHRHGRGGVQLAIPMGPDRYLLIAGIWRHDPVHALAVLGTVLAVLAAVSIPLARALVRPLERIAATARAIGRGELGARTGVCRRDEVGELARSIDDMATRLQALLAAEKALLAGVSHELRTPLARIRVALALAADDREVDEVRARLVDVERDLGDLERLVEDVLLAARLEAGTADLPVRPGPVDVAALVERGRRHFAERYPGRSLEVEVTPGPVTADGALLGRVIDNLLENAGRHGGPQVTLRATAGERLRVEVEDDGPGLSEADRERVFEPFYRADRSRARATGGVGLGLALCRAIVRAHGGEIGALPREGGGVRFWFEVPAS